MLRFHILNFQLDLQVFFGVLEDFSLDAHDIVEVALVSLGCSFDFLSLLL